MTSRSTKAAAERVIGETLRTHFDGIEITRVRVTDHTIDDGQAMLRVDVIYRGEPNPKQLGALSGAVRLLRPQLHDIGIDAFPLISFVSDKEVRTAARAVA